MLHVPRQTLGRRARLVEGPSVSRGPARDGCGHHRLGSRDDGSVEDGIAVAASDVGVWWYFQGVRRRATPSVHARRGRQHGRSGHRLPKVGRRASMIRRSVTYIVCTKTPERRLLPHQGRGQRRETCHRQREAAESLGEPVPFCRGAVPLDAGDHEPPRYQARICRPCRRSLGAQNGALTRRRSPPERGERARRRLTSAADARIRRRRAWFDRPAPADRRYSSLDDDP